MPFINVKTTEKIGAQEELALKSKLGKAIEKIPGKSEQWLMVGLEPEYTLYFRGEKNAPMAFVEVSVLGSENRAAFDAMTGEVCAILEEVLQIAPDHVYVKYEACAHWGWNGGNF